MTETKLELDGSFCVLLAAMLLVLPLGWVLAMLLAAFVHECFHYAVVTLCGGRVYALHLGIRGAQMEVSQLLPWQEILAAAAGPIGSASMIMLSPWLPRTAVCSFVHCVFNLLPLFPMDGGRILKGIMVLLLKDGEGAFRILQRILRVLLILVALWLAIRFGLWAVAIVAVLPILLQNGENCLTSEPFAATIKRIMKHKR